MQPHPLIASFDIGSLDREPCGAVSHFLLARIALVRRKSVVERFPINVLRVRRQMVTHRRRKVFVAAIWHGCMLKWWPVKDHWQSSELSQIKRGRVRAYNLKAPSVEAPGTRG
jgi:hypothetical protein